MDTVQRGRARLSETEDALQALIQEATASGEYDSVIKLTSWAQTVKGLRGAASSRKSTGSGLSSQKSRASHSTAPSDAPRAGGPDRRTRLVGSRSSYPQFYRQGDTLVKVGWSKQSRSEYVHKAARRVVELVARAICNTPVTKGRFLKAEDFLPTSDPEDGAEIANYQGYLALAWLRQAGLVEQHGREGYTWAVLGPPDCWVSEWENLPTK